MSVKNLVAKSEVFEKLALKRLAQTGQSNVLPNTPAPQEMKPNTSMKRPVDALLAALKDPKNAKIRNLIADHPNAAGVPFVEMKGEEVKVKFKPGATQAWVTAVQNFLKSVPGLAAGSYVVTPA